MTQPRVLRQIVAMGGGGFSMEPQNPRLDDYVLALMKRKTPRVCFVPTASGDSAGYIERFHAALKRRRRPPFHRPKTLPLRKLAPQRQSLFRPQSRPPRHRNPTPHPLSRNARLNPPSPAPAKPPAPIAKSPVPSGCRATSAAKCRAKARPSFQNQVYGERSMDRGRPAPALSVPLAAERRKNVAHGVSASAVDSVHPCVQSPSGATELLPFK